MAKKSESRFSYGILLIIYGFIFLLSKTGVLKLIPYGDKLLSIGSLFLIAGIIFLLTRTEKTMGIIFTLIGVLLNADFFFGWIHTYSNLIVPILLLVIGFIMVLNSRR